MEAHPLTGIKAWHNEPPEHWTPRMLERLHRPHMATAVSLAELGRHATYSYSALSGLRGVFSRDMADLAPYRARAAWRMTRAILISEQLIEPNELLEHWPIDQLSQVTPPPAPDDLSDYDPCEDEALLLWIEKVDYLIQAGQLERPTGTDPDYGRHQTSALRNPHFARAAWPSWLDVLAAEAATCVEVFGCITDGGPMRAKHHLMESHGIVGLEADSIVKLSVAYSRATYELLDEQDMKTVYAARIDSLIERARQEFRLSSELGALKLGCMLHGLVRDPNATDMDDLFDSIVEPKELDQGSLRAIAPPDRDPLGIDGPDPYPESYD